MGDAEQSPSKKRSQNDCEEPRAKKEKARPPEEKAAKEVVYKEIPAPVLEWVAGKTGTERVLWLQNMGYTEAVERPGSYLLSESDIRSEGHDLYGTSKGFTRTLWRCDKYKGEIIKSMKEASPWKVGTTLRTTCYYGDCLENASSCTHCRINIGGKGTWGDVWEACETLMDSGIEAGRLCQNHIFIEEFKEQKDGSVHVSLGS